MFLACQQITSGLEDAGESIEKGLQEMGSEIEKGIKEGGAALEATGGAVKEAAEEAVK